MYVSRIRSATAAASTQYLHFVETQDIPATLREYLRGFERLGGGGGLACTTTCGLWCLRHADDGPPATLRRSRASVTNSIQFFTYGVPYLRESPCRRLDRLP